MARYTGPKHKLARREGINLLEKESSSLLRRLTIPPGGFKGRKVKKRLSEYGQELREKQKAKAIYGLLEKQFKSLISKVTRKKGETGELLISLLETRLDNVAYRLGFAKTRAMARQLVSHGHVLVNGKRINIPSYSVKVDDVVALSPKVLKNPQILKLLDDKGKIVLPFLARKGPAGKLVRMPTSEDVKSPFDLQGVIEYYSR